MSTMIEPVTRPWRFRSAVAALAATAALIGGAQALAPASAKAMAMDDMTEEECKELRGAWDRSTGTCDLNEGGGGAGDWDPNSPFLPVRENNGLIPDGETAHQRWVREEREADRRRDQRVREALRRHQREQMEAHDRYRLEVFQEMQGENERAGRKSRSDGGKPKARAVPPSLSKPRPKGPRRGAAST